MFLLILMTVINLVHQICIFQNSGSQRWKHGSPPKMNMKILAAHNTPFYVFWSLQSFNFVMFINLFGCFLVVFWLIKADFKINFMHFVYVIMILLKMRRVWRPTKIVRWPAAAHWLRNTVLEHQCTFSDAKYMQEKFSNVKKTLLCSEKQIKET